jgi:hypothetical protein
MASQALELAGQHLERADAAMRAGDFEAMLASQEAALAALCELTRAGQVVRREPPAGSPWDAQTAERAVWELLARLKENGCSAFAFAGTLLGLERDGRLLPGDKDADIAVWLEDFGLACRLMQQLGFHRTADVPPFDNMACLVDTRAGLSVDVFGIRRDPVRKQLEGGVWIYGKPASHQRVIHLDWFELAARDGPAGQVWWPEPADVLLTGLYGDWRTPVPEWDSLISCQALRETNLHWRCWALKNFIDRWLTGDLARTRRLLDQVTARAPTDDPLLLSCRDALDAALALRHGAGA